MQKSLITIFLSILFNLSICLSQDDGFIKLNRLKATDTIYTQKFTWKNNDYRISKEDGYAALKTSNNTFIQPNKYFVIEHMHNGLLKCYMNNTFDLYDLRTEKFLVEGIDEITSVNNSYHIEKNGKKGMFWICQANGAYNSKDYTCDSNNYGLIVPPIYNSMKRYQNYSAKTILYCLLKDDNLLDVLVEKNTEIDKTLVKRDYTLQELELVDYNLSYNGRDNGLKSIEGYDQNGIQYRMDQRGNIYTFLAPSYSRFQIPRKAIHETNSTGPIAKETPIEYQLYNELAIFLGLTDTISISQNGSDVIFKFKEDILPHWNKKTHRVLQSKYIEVSKLSIKYGQFVFKADIKNSANEVTSINLQIPFAEKIVAKMESSQPGLSHGRFNSKQYRLDEYQEFYLNGELAISGQYCPIEKVVKDTIATVDPVTYETTYEVIEHSDSTKKCGTWSYFSADGKLEKQEEYE